MLGNSGSERYKLSRVLERQVPITSRPVPPVPSVLDHPGTCAFAGGCCLGHGVSTREGRRPGRGVPSTGGCCWEAAFPRAVLAALFPNCGAGCAIAFPPPEAFAKCCEKPRDTDQP